MSGFGRVQRSWLAGTWVALLLVMGLLVPVVAHASSLAPVAPGGAHLLAGEDKGDDNGTTHPAPFTWTNGAVALTFAGEKPTFYVSSLSVNRTNVSVSVPGLAEVSPNGSIVAVSSFSQDGVVWNLTWTHVSTGVQVTLSTLVSVAVASGPWNSSELPEAEGGSLGSVAVRLVFHLVNRSHASSAWTVKFDLGATGWPWVSNLDHLGMVLNLHTVGATSLEQGSDDNVEERTNATGSLVATLGWAPSALVTYANKDTANASVTSRPSFASDHSETQVRLLFGGVVGGYRALYYDPTVSVNPTAIFAHAPGSALPVWMGSTGALIGLGLGSVVVGTLVWVAYRGGAANPRDRLLRALRGGPRSPGRPSLPSRTAPADCA